MLLALLLCLATAAQLSVVSVNAESKIQFGVMPPVWILPIANWLLPYFYVTFSWNEYLNVSHVWKWVGALSGSRERAQLQRRGDKWHTPGSQIILSCCLAFALLCCLFSLLLLCSPLFYSFISITHPPHPLQLCCLKHWLYSVHVFIWFSSNHLPLITLYLHPIMANTRHSQDVSFMAAKRRCLAQCIWSPHPVLLWLTPHHLKFVGGW